MKILFVAAVSMDGYVAQSAEQNSLEWTSKEDTQFFVQKTKEAGVVVMGRKTFDTIGRPLKGRRLIVMTRQPSLSFEGEGVEYTTASATALIEQLASEGVEQVVIAGGPQIWSLFLEAGLVTDVFLTVEPVLFGGGVRFCALDQPMRFELVESRQLNEHAVMQHYCVK